MTTLHDIQTICNKEGMMLSLVLAQAMEELEKAREEGDETGVAMMNVAITMILEQIEPIEE
jgi:hypothetical protein|tara:strand:+ start:260 stop:442 length:183 start_codon:yes stop_codon:yes gene_type:complete